MVGGRAQTPDRCLFLAEHSEEDDHIISFFLSPCFLIPQNISQEPWAGLGWALHVLKFLLWVGFWTCLGSLHQMSLQRGETSLCSKQLACASGFQALLQTLSGRLLPLPLLRWSGQLPSSYLYNSCWPSPSNYGQGRRLCWAGGWWGWSFF